MWGYDGTQCRVRLYLRFGYHIPWNARQTGPPQPYPKGRFAFKKVGQEFLIFSFFLILSPACSFSSRNTQNCRPRILNNRWANTSRERHPGLKLSSCCWFRVLLRRRFPTITTVLVSIVFISFSKGLMECTDCYDSLWAQMRHKQAV